MYCQKCGFKLPDNAKFCLECGTKIEKINNSKSTGNKYISLTCSKCGGTLEVDPNRPIISCPYCNSSTLVEEADNVKVERVKAKAYTDVNKAKYDAEKAKQKVKSDEAKYEYRIAVLLVITILFFYLVILR